MPTDGGWNGDRQVDLVDVGAYLAYADSNGLAGGVAGREHFGRPLQRAFDVDADGQLDTFDWYGLQGCYARTGGRCAALFDADGSGGVGQADVTAFEAEASGLFGGPQRPRWRRGLIASRYGNPFMWTGQRFDPTTGQYHFWARTYSPRLGRWMQRDPLEYLDSVSLYEGLGSSPLVYVDPAGGKITYSDFRNSDGTITRHYYDFGIFAWLNTGYYLGTITFDPDDPESEQFADDFTRVKQFFASARNGATAVEGGMYGAVVIMGILIPGPDDVLWGAILSKFGARIVWRSGEKLFEVAGKLLTKAEVRALVEARELLEQNLRKIAQHVLERAHFRGWDIEKIFSEMLRMIEGYDDMVEIGGKTYYRKGKRILIIGEDGTGTFFEPDDIMNYWNKITCGQ